MDFEKLKDWIIDKWLAGFITGGIYFLGKLYFDMPDEQKGRFFNFQWFWNLMNVGIKAWQVFLALVIAIFFHRLQIKKLKNSNQEQIIKDDNPNPELVVSPPFAPFQNYKSDFFGSSKEKWSWDYAIDHHNKEYNVINLAPNCPTCDSPMELTSMTMGYLNALCYRCRLEGKQHHQVVRSFRDDVKLEIFRRVKNREFHT